jgi:DNA repair exonuclease SbcCD ATPase subunit/predicted MPP superfamily phosphohydrolase
MEIIKKEFNYKSEIKKIIHISDIHIPLFKRNDEYLEVFETLYNKIKSIKNDLKIEENSNIPIIIVITGDILHSKSDLSPECIFNTRNFIKNLLKLLPVVIIPGNHDVNMNNNNRLDSITPILDDLSNNEQLYYLVHTGIYTLNNIVFSHASIYDYNIIPSEEIETKDNQVKIALFHGRINGVETNNGFTLSGEVSKNTNKTITVSAFNNYDLVLLGDIHNHQFIKKHIAYAGSLIQQNISEDLTKHGLILWDIESKTGVFHRIKNNYGYLEVVIDNKQVNKEYLMTKNESNPNIPKNIHLRVLYKNTPISYVEDFVAIAKMHHNVVNVFYNNIDNNNSSLDNKDSSNLMQINLTLPEEQNKYIESYLKENTSATEEDINIIKQLNIKTNESIDVENIVELRNFKIISLEFSNLFSYGLSNFINFKDFNGIVGIIADNHMGKSSILEIILFAIYDKFSRKGGIKDMINNRKNNFKIHIVLQIEDYQYHIIKSGSRTKTSSVSQKIQFYRVKGNINECLEEDTLMKTKEVIKRYFGNYNDIINTNFSIQNNSNQFIDSENTARRKELERILNIDFIDILYKKGQEAFSKNKTILDHISTKVNPNLGAELGKDKIKYIANLEKITKIKEECQSIINEKRNELILLNQKLTSIDNLDEIDIDKLQLKLKESVSNETTLILNFVKLKKDIDIDKLDSLSLDSITEQIQKTDSTFSDTITKYNLKIQKYNSLLIQNTAKLREIEDGNYEEEINKLEKSINKLDNDINTLEYDINNKSNLDTIISNYKNKIKKENKEFLKLQKETLPSSLNSYLKDNKPNTLKKNFKNDEETLFNRLKIDDGDYSKYQEYKNYSSSSQNHYFYKEINNYTKNNGKQEIMLKNSIESLEMNLDTVQKEKEKVQKFKITLESKKREKESLQKELSRLKTIVVNNENNKKHNENIKTILKTNNEGLIKYEKAKQNVERKYSIDKKGLNNLLNIVNYRDKVNSVVNNIRIIKNDIDRYNKNKEVIENNKKINKIINDITETIKQLENKLKEIDFSFNKANADLTQTLARIKQFISDNKERKSYEKKKQLNLWYKDSLKRLPFYIIQNVVPIIEKKANDLLSVISDFNIKIEISDNKIDIYLKRSIYNNIDIILNNASGFEKFVSSLAIRLAILSVSNLPKINFMAIDEGWSCLDNHNINNVKTILEYISQNFDFVLTISHLTEIKQHCDHQILLKKDDANYSCVNLR